MIDGLLTVIKVQDGITAEWCFHSSFPEHKIAFEEFITHPSSQISWINIPVPMHSGTPDGPGKPALANPPPL